MILVVGVSGAGKGTQSELFARETGYTYLATGEMLRQYATPDQKARMLSGELLRDDEVIAMVDEALRRQTSPNRVILDGFPRTKAQAEWLLGNATRSQYAIEAVVCLNVTSEVVLARLRVRGREDDTSDAIAARLAWHEERTKPVVELFRAKGCTILEIDGNGTSEQVHSCIMDGLKGHMESMQV